MSHSLWIRSEVFDHGIFNTSVRWTAPKVLDFLGSLKEALGGLTTTQSAWVQAVTTRSKPQLNEAEATAYWNVFSVLHEALYGKLPESIDIRTIGLILSCQVFSVNRVGKTDQLAKSGEMWPGFERASMAVSSPRHSPRGTSPRAAAQMTVTRGKDFAAALISFVRQNFGHLLQVVCMTLSGEPPTCSLEEFNLLGFLLCGGPSLSQPLDQVGEAVPEFEINPAMPFMELRKVVEKSLVWNDEVYSLEPTPATPSRTVNVTGMSKSTWFYRPSSVKAEYLNISGCNDCAIYVTQGVRFCLVANCHDCSIILGAVSAVCTIQNCEKISVHVAAHSFKMESCIDSSAYLFGHLPPIISGDSRGVKLAPYNVMYSALDEQLEAAGVPLDPEYIDVWSNPICCTLGSLEDTLGRKKDEAANHTTYHFVHPLSFVPVIVPELTKPTAGTVRLVLPQVYNDAFEERKEEMRSFFRQLAEIEDEAKKKKAQQAIQGHFRDWMHSNGKSRQLADLARMGAGKEKL